MSCKRISRGLGGRKRIKLGHTLRRPTDQEMRCLPRNETERSLDHGGDTLIETFRIPPHPASLYGAEHECGNLRPKTCAPRLGGRGSPPGRKRRVTACGFRWGRVSEVVME